MKPVMRRIIALEPPTPEPESPPLRPVALGERTIHLFGAPPAVGRQLLVDFAIPAGRGTKAPLRRETLCDGLCFVSTLPNIEKHACVAQIVHLHEHCQSEFPEAAVHHVSSDSLKHWQELDFYHGDVTACGYSLSDAEPAQARAFKQAFGVGVLESHRVAHGLFALENGRFLASEIPGNQFMSADIDGFLSKVRAARVT